MSQSTHHRYKPRASGGVVYTLCLFEAAVIAAALLHQLLAESEIMLYSLLVPSMVLATIAAVVLGVGHALQKHELIIVGFGLATFAVLFCIGGFAEWISSIVDCAELHSSSVKSATARQCHSEMLSRVRGTATVGSGTAQCLTGTRVMTWAGDVCAAARTTAVKFHQALTGMTACTLIAVNLYFVVRYAIEAVYIWRWHMAATRLQVAMETAVAATNRDADNALTEMRVAMGHVITDPLRGGGGRPKHQ
jgi:hypothetical protein